MILFLFFQTCGTKQILITICSYVSTYHFFMQVDGWNKHITSGLKLLCVFTLTDSLRSLKYERVLCNVISTTSEYVEDIFVYVYVF